MCGLGIRADNSVDACIWCFCPHQQLRWTCSNRSVCIALIESSCRRYTFTAVEKLQCPELQSSVTAWKEVRHLRHLHQHQATDDDSQMPSLALDTRVSFARFVLEGAVESCQGKRLLVRMPKYSVPEPDSQPLSINTWQPMTADDVSNEVEKGLRLSRSKRGA